MLETECIPHTGTVNKQGKGLKWKNGKLCRVHRLAYEEHIGPIPPNTYVLQKCGNSRCINPEHLFLSEKSEARFLQCAKSGVDNPRGNSKLSEEEVMQILDYRHTYYEYKRLRKLGKRDKYERITLQSIADKFGVTPSTIQRIFADKAHKHIGAPDEEITNVEEIVIEEIKDREQPVMQ